MLLLTTTGLKREAEEWLTELVNRTDYTYKIKRNFPISSESIEDLAEVTFSTDDKFRDSLMRTSWLIPTLATWSVILGQDDLYEVLANNSKNSYPEICLQLWHPTTECAQHMYYRSAADHCGEVEAPICLPDTLAEYREMMRAILNTPRFDISTFSPACLAGMDAIDLIACRHFRTPVAPSFWFSLLDTHKEGT
jgi:hypothetical protein